MLSHILPNKLCLQVEHQKEFEPYVMLKTVDSPLFYEIQLERMGDKFTYVLEIHKKG